jgi:hypothetical protein
MLYAACGAGCGDETGRAPSPSLDIDAGEEPDAESDADVSPDTDGAMAADDAGSDAGSDADSSVVVEGPVCTFPQENLVNVSESFLDPSDRPSLALRNEGALLSWVAYESGKPRLMQRYLGVDGLARELPRPEDDTKQTEPTSVATPGGFLTVWSDDANGGYHLRARRTSSSGELQDELPIALTDGADEDHLPVAATGPDGNTLVVWEAKQPAPETRAMLVGADGKPGAVRVLEAVSPAMGRVALATIPSGYVLAYVRADTRRVFLQPLDKQGEPLADAVRVDADGDARGHLSLTASAEGGALAWDVLLGGERPEVRLHTFDAKGALSGVERIVTPYPAQGAEPVIAATDGGYALAYRGGNIPTSALQITLLDTRCQPAATVPLTDLASANMGVVLAASPDSARMFLGWLDAPADSPSYVFRRAWGVCSE